MILRQQNMVERVKMSHFAKNNFLVLLMCLVFVSTPVLCELKAFDVNDKISDQLKKDELSAYLIAFNMFSEQIHNKFLQEDIRKYGENSYSVYAANKSNYIVMIRKLKKSPKFIVEFKIKNPAQFGGILGSGGRKKYVVDIKSNKVKRIYSGK